MARLEVGQAAPDFSVTAVDGTEIDSASFEGTYTLLSFFRYAGCPFCDLTLIKLVERYQNFAIRGLKVVAFFQSPQDTVDDYVKNRHPPFPIVADPDKHIYDKYAIESSKLGGLRSIPGAVPVGLAIASGKTSQPKITGDSFLMPAQFLIGPDKVLRKVHYGTNFSDKLPFIEIEQVLLTEIETAGII